jgi:hypothetical protein
MARDEQPSFEVPAKFWTQFLEHHWNPARPGVIPQPFATPLVTSEDVFHALLAQSERLAKVDSSLSTVLSLDKKPQLSTEELVAHRAMPSDGSLDGYMRRVLAETGARDFSLFQRYMHVLDEKILWNVLEIFRSLWMTSGVPLGGATSSSFLGNYRETFLGVHKDHFNVITYVVEGSKRFLLWPYEHFAALPHRFAIGMPPVTGDARHCFAIVDQVDWREHEHSALVLEAKAGDVVYWPSTYWHVADSEEDRLSVTLFMGCIPHIFGARPSPFEIYDEALKSAERSRLPVESARTLRFPFGHPEDEAAVEAAFAEVERNAQRVLADAQVRRHARKRVLAWMTGFGFQRIADPRALRAVGLEDRLRSDARYPIYWIADNPDDPNEVTLSIHGHLMPTHKSLLPLVRYLNEGRSFVAREVVERFASEEGLPSEAVLAVLATFASVRALSFVGTGCSIERNA